MKDVTSHIATCLVYIIFSMGMVCTPATLLSQDRCILKYADENIKVLSCERSDSDFNAIKAELEVMTTLSQYASLVLDIDSYHEWNYAARNARIISRISDTELIYYAEMDSPWPVTDRYVILRLKVNQNPDSKVLKINLNLVPELMTEKEGFVRVKEYHSQLLVVPVSNEKVSVDFILTVDPGGIIPEWVINLVSTKFPVKTFSNIKTRLESQTEIEQLEFIDNY